MLAQVTAVRLLVQMINFISEFPAGNVKLSLCVSSTSLHIHGFHQASISLEETLEWLEVAVEDVPMGHKETRKIHITFPCCTSRWNKWFLQSPSSLRYVNIFWKRNTRFYRATAKLLATGPIAVFSLLAPLGFLPGGVELKVVAFGIESQMRQLHLSLTPVAMWHWRRVQWKMEALIRTLGLGTNLRLFYGTDRKASMVPNVKIWLFCLCQVLVPRS